MAKSKTHTSAGKQFDRLISVMARLRGPHGCPWDKHQTHRSLLPYLFEESHELKKAIAAEDWENIEEELGDILLQIIFHGQIAAEKGRFSTTDIITTLTKKLIRRHPHVFGGKKLRTKNQVITQWAAIKRLEKKKRPAPRAARHVRPRRQSSYPR